MLYEITINVNLQTSSDGIVQKGRVFRGPLEELSPLAQRLLKENDPRICTIKEFPQVEERETEEQVAARLLAEEEQEEKDTAEAMALLETQEEANKKKIVVKRRRPKA